MTHGGNRKGAGRKKGYAAVTAEEARRVLAEMVTQEIEPIGKALVERAKKGEIPAIRELFDRAWGKPRQALEIVAEEENKPIDAAKRNRLEVLVDEIEEVIKREAPGLDSEESFVLLARRFDERLKQYIGR